MTCVSILPLAGSSLQAHITSGVGNPQTRSGSRSGDAGPGGTGIDRMILLEGIIGWFWDKIKKLACIGFAEVRFLGRTLVVGKAVFILMQSS